MAALNLGEWLLAAEDTLQTGPHPVSARQDAELLVRSLLGEDRAWLLTHRDSDLSSEQLELLNQHLSRRTNGEPIQYITGETEFYGLPFRVTSDILIPRPETEHLVEKVLALAAHFQAPRIVDVGAGSGAIAVALAHHLPHASLTAIDLSSPALAIARENAVHNGVQNRIRFVQGDLLAPVAEERFEIVVSNPPYVPTGDKASLAVEVRDFEPALALFAGKDGLDIYRRIIPDAFAALVPGGCIALEIGYGQQAAIRALLAESGFEEIEFTSDLQGIPRVAFGLRRLSAP